MAAYVGWILPRPSSVYGAVACAHFLGQAVDEYLDGNLFNQGYWEYGLLAVAIVLTWLITRKQG